MKRTFILFLATIMIMFIGGCSENNPTDPVPNKSKQISNHLSKGKTDFFGSTTFQYLHEEDAPTAKPLPNGKVILDGRVSVYYDDVNDPRVKGFSTWYINKAHLETDGSMHFTGKAELLVDNNGGKWEMSWHGLKASDGSIIDYATGRGTEGAVKGLVAKWIYTRPAGMPDYYDIEGYIVDKM